MRFADLPRFPRADYHVDVEWRDLCSYIERSVKQYGLELEPDFQRGHVWTAEQQIAFVEYGLMGGESSMTITANHPHWQTGKDGPYQLVDGLQRVTAVMRFYNNEIPAFGAYLNEYTDRARMIQGSFKWHILTLASRADVLHQYLLMNAGGVVHSPEEIVRVRKLLEGEMG